MKKGVILIISCICVISVFFIAFFGVISSNIYPRVYIEKITIQDIDGNAIPEKQGSKTLIVKFLPDEYLGTDSSGRKMMQYFFNTDILPENVTNRSFNYRSSSSGENALVEITKSNGGAILIKEKLNVSSSNPYFITTITCEANDGSPLNVQDKISLVIDYTDYLA